MDEKPLKYLLIRTDFLRSLVVVGHSVLVGSVIYEEILRPPPLSPSSIRTPSSKGGGIRTH